MKKIVDYNRVRLFKSSNSYILNNPTMLFLSKKNNFINLYKKLIKDMDIILSNERTRFFKLETSYVLENPKILYQFKAQHLDKLIEKLDVLNPLNTLKRGYSIVKSNDKVISDIKKIKKGSLISVELSNGYINALVEKVGKK